MAWTKERRERFQATLAAKQTAKQQAGRQQPVEILDPELGPGPGVAPANDNGQGEGLVVNGRSISLDDALAVYAAVDKMRRSFGS